MLIYKYEIPDPKRPLKKRTAMGPSGKLIPFRPDPADPSKVIGREIAGWIPYAGTYGMGGPGFVGFNLNGEWLIIAIWGAAAWIRLDGRLLEDIFSDRHGRKPGWNAEPEEIRHNLFTGRHFAEFQVERTSVIARLDDDRVLSISEDPADRPPFEGNGQPREIGPNDDLRRVVFLAPTTEIVV
jgi:hypothetical protein